MEKLMNRALLFISELLVQWYSHQLPLGGGAALQGWFWKANFPKIGCDLIKFLKNRVWFHKISIK